MTASPTVFYFETYMGVREEGHRVNASHRIDYDTLVGLYEDEIRINHEYENEMDTRLLHVIVGEDVEHEIVAGLKSDKQHYVAMTEEGTAGFSLISAADAKMIVAMYEIDNDNEY